MTLLIVFCFWDNWNKSILMPKSKHTTPLGPHVNNLAGSLGCTWWNQNTPHLVNNLNMIDWTHIRGCNVPMLCLSVISMVEKFISSPNFVIIPKHVIISSRSIRIFVGNIPSDPSKFRKTLPNHLLQFFDISPLVIGCEIIPFHPNGPQCHASQKKAKATRICSLMMEPLSQRYHVANTTATMGLFVLV